MSTRKKPSYFKLHGLKNVPRTVEASCATYQEYRVDSHILGEGSYGKVMPVCKGDICTDVAKVITFDFQRFPEPYRYNVFFAECVITKFAGEKGFGIPVKTFFLCDEGKRGVMIMERFRRDLVAIANEFQRLRCDKPIITFSILGHVEQKLDEPSVTPTTHFSERLDSVFPDHFVRVSGRL